MNKKQYEKNVKQESKVVYVPVEKVNNKPHQFNLKSYGQISPVTELMVSFEVQGKLIQGNKRLKPGVKFSKNEILYNIDRQEFIFSIASRKTSLAGMVAQAIPDIILDYPSQEKNWKKFSNALSPNRLLPELPPFSSEKERLFWTTRNVLTEYYNILSLEKRVEKYVYIAPFSGTVVEVYSEPGSIINPGVQIAKIARTGDYELKVPVALSVLERYKKQGNAEFTDSEGKLIATGSILRVSDVVNQSTQSADVYYSVEPVNDAQIYNGMYLNVSINHKTVNNTVILPRTAVSDDKVYVLKGNKLEPISITNLGAYSDSVYVTGLQDGQEVVLEQVTKLGKGITYKRSDRE